MFKTHSSVSLSTFWSMIIALIAAAAGLLLLAMAFSALYLNSAGDSIETFGDVPKSLVDQRARIENELVEARRARIDMFLHASEHGMAMEAESAFGPMAAYDNDWNLYYSDVITTDGKVTLYTAVNKRVSLIRYTATWDAANGWATPWEPVLW